MDMLNKKDQQSN
uniref:Uncharacterized protein n=1 Tax=Anguilla anguilla TaxID=7936 RepID=A0A0E9UES8_ANGAN